MTGPRAWCRWYRDEWLVCTSSELIMFASSLIPFSIRCYSSAALTITWVLETLKALGIENPPQVCCTQMHSVTSAITRSASMVDSAEQWISGLQIKCHSGAGRCIWDLTELGVFHLKDVASESSLCESSLCESALICGQYAALWAAIL
jgi:hypothetical protein